MTVKPLTRRTVGTPKGKQVGLLCQAYQYRQYRDMRALLGHYPSGTGGTHRWLNWAERAGNGRGSYLVERNPLKGLNVPSEESPRRSVLTTAQYDAVRVAAAGMSVEL